MTVVYTNEMDRELLDFCKRYIRRADCTPSQFVHYLSRGLVELAEDNCREDIEHFERIEIVTPS